MSRAAFSPPRLSHRGNGPATIPQSSSVAYQFGISVPLLVGNIMSISISEAISVLGSLLKPEDFNFSVMKQKIAVV